MPTHLIKQWIQDLAQKLRNSDDYCDWEVGMEPIAGDKTWVKQKYECKNENCSCRMK